MQRHNYAPEKSEGKQVAKIWVTQEDNAGTPKGHICGNAKGLFINNEQVRSRTFQKGPAVAETGANTFNQ